MIINILVETH